MRLRGTKAMPVTVEAEREPADAEPDQHHAEEVERLDPIGAHVLDVAGDEHDADEARSAG